ncbi:MAG: ImmA/IrrE family metallo-endopeptidase [bacterium]|nr:ImmA/IrrE family metallo-endopeptidase [bacterium]
MSKNRILSQRTEQDIDQRIERVIKGLGNPEPPLKLDDVRALLKLDRGFYTADDPGLASEVINRIRVATIQVYHRPTLIIDVIKKLSLKALYLPDRKRILLDSNLPEKKHRWNEAHEIGHSLIPWHDDMMLGDNDQTLSRDCHEQVEAEANYAAGRLLFLRERFMQEAKDMPPSMDSVRNLHKRFGNTISTTLYRFVESRGARLPMLGLISRHPHRVSNSTETIKHFIRSPIFAENFSHIDELEIYRGVASYCGSQSGGLLGSDELTLKDDNGDEHIFYFETFYNRYDALTIGIYIKPVKRLIS